MIVNQAIQTDRHEHTDSPLVLCVAPNGARRTKADHPRLPIEPEELAKEARACRAAGAQVIHLHVRGADGGHILDVGRYRAAIGAIRASAPDMIIQATSESVGIYSAEAQEKIILELNPEAASVALRELAPDGREDAAASFYSRAHQSGVAVQHILYSTEDARRFRLLKDRGVICEPTPNVLFVLGRYSQDQTSQPSDALAFLDEWPAEWPWSLCAFGRQEALCMALAVALGGHCRVGFENNLMRADGSLAAGNYENLQNVAALAMAAGRRLATPSEAAAIYGLSNTTPSFAR